MDLHEKDKPLRSCVRYFLVFLFAMGVVWWFSSMGPDSVKKEAALSKEIFDGQGQEVDDTELLRQSQSAETAFNEARARSDALQPEAAILLEEAIRLQRTYIDRLGRVDVQAIARLKALETRLANEQAKVLLDDSLALEAEGRKALAQGDKGAAANALYQAAFLQKEINKNYPLSNATDYGRPVRLSRLIQDLEAKPLSEDSYRAEREAREALAKGNEGLAMEAFTEALNTQNTINEEYKNTQYVDLHRVKTLQSELQNLQAQGIYSAFSERLKEAKLLDNEKAFTQAAGAYSKALALQQTINENYPQSRYASSERVSAIRGAIDVAQGQGVLEGIKAQSDAIQAALAANNAEKAKSLLTQVQKEWISLKSKYGLTLQAHRSLEERIDYWVSKASSLEAVLNRVYSSLLPIPGTPKKRMLKTEVPQSLYTTVMDQNPSRNVGDALPVDSVRYEDAELFCKRLGFLVGRVVTLPDEVSFRAAVGAVDTQAVVSETWNAENSDYKTHPVGTKLPNMHGFFDLLGNVAEWLHSDTPTKAFVGGGSIEDSPSQLVAVPMTALPGSDRSRSVGFRVMIPE